jgi:heat shock protein HtpX
MGSQLKTILFLGVLSALAVGAASLYSSGAAVVVGGLAVAMNLFSYFYSDRVVLRMHQAQELSRAEAPELHQMNDELAAAAGIPAPRLYLVRADYANAFATGRGPGHAAIAVTSGIVQKLNRRELRGVMAHEMAHVKNRDVLIASVAAMMASVITMIANVLQFSLFFGGAQQDEDGGSPIGALIFAMLAPLGASLVQLAISRAREFVADATAARLTGDPESLALALSRLSADAAQPHMVQPAPATASLYIVNPFTGGGLASLFSTHPPMEERIARLRRLAQRPIRVA